MIGKLTSVFTRASLVAVLALLDFSIAHAGPNLKNEWMKKGVNQAPNSTFLFNVTHGVDQNPYALRDEILDPSIARGLKMQYDGMVRDYEMKELYNMNSPNDELLYNGQMRAFSQHIMDEVRSYQERHNTNKLKDSVKEVVRRDSTLMALKKPAAIVGATAAVIYFNRSIDVKLGESTQLTARPQLRQKRGGISLSSPWISSAVDVVPQAPNERNPFEAVAAGTLADEKYQFSLSRGLPVIDVSSGLSYGTTTGTMKTSLSRGIAPNLTCAFEAHQSVKFARASGSGNVEEVLKFLYRLDF